METIRVNMTPCEDVQTIHASQNDNEAREWGFELHNNGDVIDSSSISDQMVFKAYEGGTEQLLPENTSTPNTTPILADIQYPDGLRTDQYFTYRETPTTVSNKARIKTIKGNTMVWNQLVENGNFADGLTNWSKSTTADTATVSNNVLSFHASSVYGSISNTLPTDINNHLILAKAQVRINGNDGMVRVKVTNDFGYTNETFAFSITEKNVWKDVLMYGVYQTTPSASSSSPKIGFADYRSVSSDNLIEAKNVQVFDLTQMGLDITEPIEFTSLFGLSYYAYNAGTLLSFTGTGLKTTGKNLYTATYRETFTDNGITFTNMGEGRFIANGTATNTGWLSLAMGASNFVHQVNLPRGTYTFSVGADKIKVYTYASSDLAIVSQGDEKTTIVDSPLYGVRMLIPSGTVFNNTEIYMQIEIGSTATSYEPYTESTLSLPISTYFPNGMKSAGSAYDELTPTKAITRIGAVDLGTLSWNWQSTWQAWYTYQISTSLKGASNNDTKPNIVSANYPTLALNNILGTSTFGISISNVLSESKLIAVENGSDTVTPTGYLYYELKTSTETSFSTASLVTENAEIPLSNEDGVLIGKCTEQLSSESGFFDAKIKLADADGECYSNKIQLHVERSPQ